jgi:hypothetical protein
VTISYSPEFADLDWKSAGLAIEPRPTQGDDRLGITGTFCAIAETVSYFLGFTDNTSPVGVTSRERVG